MPDVRPPSRDIVPAEPLVPDRNSSPAVTSATRSTEERAFARTCFRRPRLSDGYATHKPPHPGRRTGSALTYSCAPHASHPSGFPAGLASVPGSTPRRISFSRAGSSSLQTPGVRSSHASKPPRSSFLPRAHSAQAVPPHGPRTPRAFEAIRHPAFRRFAALTHTTGGGLTPACSGLATLAADARR